MKSLLSLILSSSLPVFFALSSANANNSVIAPTSVAGGTGLLTSIQAADENFYSVTQASTMIAGKFPAIGGEISSVVLHVKFSVQPGEYSGTNALKVNGIDTGIIPMAGDVDYSASVNITSSNFRINTWPEITALSLSFANNDAGSSQSVDFDHIYLAVTHTTLIFAPPTWSDEFDDSGPPNPAVWTFEQGFVRNEELQWYQSDNAWQQNGNLIIEGRRLPARTVRNPNYVARSSDWRTSREFIDYTSSSIISQGKYSFKYGRMQVRAKIPCFPGTWPAIWTIGNAGEWPSCGECDVLEYYSPDSVLANLAKGSNTRWSASWDAVKKPVSPTFTNGSPNWRNEYHIWTMQWDEQNIRLYLDNHLMNTTAQSWLVNPVTTWGPKEPFKQPHFLLLNLALGGAGGDPRNTAFPLRYELDYVRVWEGLTGNQSPTDIALSSNTVPEGLPSGTVVGNLLATDVDAAEVHSFSLVSGTGSTHNDQFEVIFQSDQSKTSVLRTKSVLNSASGATRSIRVRVTDIEGATFDKALTVRLDGQFVIETAPSTLTIPEGTSSTFNVRLRVAPTNPITVSVSRQTGDEDLQVSSGSSLLFTPANATTWQTVTLAAANDTDRTNGAATFLCRDASRTFSDATVVANEADSNPILPATVTLSQLNQTFNGGTKAISITTDPPGLSHVTTYDGQFMAPIDAGTYEVEVTIDDPDYSGITSSTLVVAKASQSIEFPTLNQLPDTSPPIVLNVTSSSGLPIIFTSSNPSVASVSGNLLSVLSAGTTNITASQAGNDNFNAAESIIRPLNVSRTSSLAVINPTSPVLSTQMLALNGSSSLPSDGNTITEYSWDLNNDQTFGDVTGATPAPISHSNLINTWGMVDGLNPVSLRITDSAGQTATVSILVEVVISLTWDSNGSDSLQTDGAGEWTTASQWWNGTSNTTWVSGDDAIFGQGGSGGSVTLAIPTTVNTLTFNAFTDAYTLGTAGQTMTLTNGIIKNASGTGAATIISPVTLAAAQSWINQSSGLLTVGPSAVTNAGFSLTVGGTGNTTVSASISGAGGLTKADAGTLRLEGSNSYSGTTSITGGALILSNANTLLAATSVGASGTLQLGHATSLGTSTLTLASGATLQLRNDQNTTFTAPITNPTAAVTYNFDVNNAGSAETGKRLSLGNLSFAIPTTGSVTNRLNITGGNGYTLAFGTLTALSGGDSSHPLVLHPTTAGIAVSRVVSGSFGTALTFTGTNTATLGEFILGSNGNHSVIVNGATVTLGTTTATNGRSNGANAYTLTSGTLNLTTTTSIANVKLTGTGTTPAPTFAINGGTLNNTSGSALTLGGLATATQNNRPTITLGGNFAFGTALSTSANDLNLGTIAIPLAANRTITINGATTLTLDGIVSGGFALTKNGSGTMTLGGQNTYTGNTVISSGTLAISSTGGIYSTGYTAGPIVTVSNGATLQVAAWQYGPNGGLKNLDLAASRLLVNGGTITYTGAGEGQGSANNGRLFTIGTGGATLHAAGTNTWFIESNAQYDLTNGQVIPNGLTLTLSGSANGRYSKILSGQGSLTKSGTGTWTLAGSNTYSGNTNINAGTLIISGATQATRAINVAANGSLGLVIGSPVTAASAAVNLTNGTVTVSGTPSAPSHVLLTALSITNNTPVLASPIPGYSLQVSGNQLLLIQAVSSPYDTWKNQITNGLVLRTDDADGDTFTNEQEFLFGTSPTTSTSALTTFTTGTQTLTLRWLQRETGASYTLKHSSTLAPDAWQTLSSPTPAIDPDQTSAPADYDFHSVTIPTTQPRSFFRIEAVEN